MYYNHGYEGIIEFDIEPTLRDKLVSETTKCLNDGERDGNEFYFDGNKVVFLYPSEYYQRKREEYGDGWEQKMDSYGFSGQPVIEERIHVLFRWNRENGVVVRAEITPYSKLFGQKFEKTLATNNEFYRSISIEKPVDTNDSSFSMSEMVAVEFKVEKPKKSNSNFISKIFS